mgnify:CR=1 FL=1
MAASDGPPPRWKCGPQSSTTGSDRPAASEPYQLGWDTLDQIFDRLDELRVDTVVSKPYQRYTLGAGAAGWATPRAHAERY